MKKEEFNGLVSALSSSNDSDALLALHALIGYLKKEGIDLQKAFGLIHQHLDQLKRESVTFDAVVESVATPAARPPLSVSGVPQCHVPKQGCIELVVPGSTQGELVMLPGASAENADMIADAIKDALLAAVLNKSRFKLKLLDIKDSRGQVVETALQAEYDRAGMTPIRIWSHARGEVASLAAVLRKAVANSFPDLVAA